MCLIILDNDEPAGLLPPLHAFHRKTVSKTLNMRECYNLKFKYNICDLQKKTSRKDVFLPSELTKLKEGMSGICVKMETVVGNWN